VTAFYRIDGRRMALAEYWRLSPGVLTFATIAVRKLFQCPPRFSFAIHRPDRLLTVAFEDLPASARFGLQPAMRQLEEAGLSLVFFYRLEVPEPHRLGAAAVLRDDAGEIRALVAFSQERDVKQSRVSFASNLTDGTVAVTTAAKKTLEPVPVYRTARFPGADPLALLDRHRAHLARLAEDGLFPVKVDAGKLQATVLESEQRYVDFHIERGLFVPLTEEELARLRGPTA
jgi:hypothetical protein